jgi:CheY-like chemotaxis protein
VDPVQLEEILLALVANASEAATEGARVTITTDLSRRGDEEPSYDFLPASHGGPLAVLEVEDHGHGMDSATLNRAFEPFFSTHFTGRGLGLATVLGIVRGHRAALAVRSSPGCGTTIRIMFPAATGAASAGDRSVRATVSDRPVVLMVDGDTAVREYAIDMLDILGFEGRAAANGRAALAAVGELDHRLVCVLLDLTMPGMSGVELFQRLQSEVPDVPVVVVSGYAEDDVRHRFGDRQPAGFIHKPFNIAAVREVLRDLLT